MEREGREEGFVKGGVRKHQKEVDGWMGLFIEFGDFLSPVVIWYILYCIEVLTY